MASNSNWVAARPREIPAPTYWPVTLAVGVTAVAGGLVTSWVVAAVGAALMVVALQGWIRDMVRVAPAPQPTEDVDE